MNKIKLTLFAVVCFLNQTYTFSQGNLRIAFYNVENLFDTLDNPAFDDQEYLPNAQKNWDSKKYKTKIEHLAYVINNINPDIIGLSEIEEKQVVIDLAADPLLLDDNFGVVHHQTTDPRGIEQALLYDKTRWKVKSSQMVFINEKLTNEDSLYRRGILYVQLKSLKSKFEDCHVFVNHWKSRRGGQDMTSQLRIKSAQSLKNTINKIKSKEPKAKILVVGDFNDGPDDMSLLVLSEGKSKDVLFNSASKIDTKTTGTYYFKPTKSWDVFDQILIDKATAKANNFPNEIIYNDDKVVFKNFKTGESMPNQTYGIGDKYYGGYSDHYPVYLDLKLR